MAWIKGLIREMFVVSMINYEKFTCVISLNGMEENLNRIVDGGAGELWTGDCIGSYKFFFEGFFLSLRQQNYKAGDMPNPSTDFFAC